jgi:ubiquinone/menaquinone biosynthesis C-methylase UbiE
MNTQQAYNIWSEQYDTNENKTRDLEAISLREHIKGQTFEYCLEIGCGTGKNTAWLMTQSKRVLAVDLSEEMLAKAKQKISASNVDFIQADITNDWSFTNGNQFDLATFSLVLEHIEDLEAIFAQLNKVMQTNAIVYIGELHPFKQYNGSKARFETSEGLQVVTCFNHHITEFVEAAANKNHFELININEYFDENDKNNIPRILTMLFKKKKSSLV